MSDSREGIAAMSSPTFWRVLGAPWLSIVRPEEAGLRMARAGKLAFWISLTLSWLALSATRVAIAIWGQTTVWETTLSDACEAWIDDGAWLVRWTSAWTLVEIIMVYSLSAILLFPRVHRGVSIRASLAVAGRAIAAAAGPAIFLSGIMSVASIFLTRAMYESYNRLNHRPKFGGVFEPGPIIPDDPLLALVLCAYCICVPLWFIWASKAARGACTVLPEAERHPLCEGCGYELVHQSSSGRCTECGTELAKSIDSSVARPGSPWERRRSPLSWLKTTSLAMFYPAKLYRLAPARGDDRWSSAFAISHYVLLTIAAFALLRWNSPRYFAVWTWESPSHAAVRATATIILTTGLYHRGVGALVMLLAAKLRWTPPGVRLGMIVDYQVVFLWLLVIVGGAWMYAMGLRPVLDWKVLWPSITSWLDGSWRSGPRLGWIPSLVPSPAIAALLQHLLIWGPPVLLALFWMRRYALAFRAVRWANF